MEEEIGRKKNGKPTGPDWEDYQVTKAFSNTINPGEKLRLRDDVLPLVKRRSWIFAGMGKRNMIILGHEDSGYIWEVRPDSIDWREYKKRNDLDQRSG